MAFSGNPGFKHDSHPRIGVLITNLGTPSEPTAAAVRRYLREFLGDPRVVELPRLLWLPILHGIILNTRPAKSARLYQKIWTENGSPLAHITRQQSEALASRLQQRFGDNCIVDYAMRYGEPSIAHGLQKLLDAGAEKLVVLPLYPQYAGSTTGSTFDALASYCSALRWVPELHLVNSYHDHSGYINACARRIRDYWAEQGRSQKLLFSFHGLPRAHLENGDPYFCHCHKTARLIAEQLNLAEDDYLLTFQSRLGRQEWLRPYTDQTLEQLGADGLGSIDVFCPGFAADCLETLEEIALQNRQLFLDAGGRQFRYIPALNDMPEHIDALVEILAPILDYYQGLVVRDAQQTDSEYQRKK